MPEITHVGQKVESDGYVTSARHLLVGKRDSAAHNLTTRDDLGAARCLWTGQGARKYFVRRVNLDEYVMIF